MYIYLHIFLSLSFFRDSCNLELLVQYDGVNFYKFLFYVHSIILFYVYLYQYETCLSMQAFVYQ